MDNYSLYEDIKARTGGEIYLGVVGPVRTGKSTFIKKFMDLCIIPSVTDPNEKRRIIDELPQSGVGRTVMTTEPKFIPKNGVEVTLSPSVRAKFRLIDCVGFIVDGVEGIYEADRERMVKTPWFDENIPFGMAAETGTKKVITDHSTIGIIVTTDGSIGELTRESFIEAEEKAIKELKAIHKPFIVILNTTLPDSAYAKSIAEDISKKHAVTTLPMDCENLKNEDIEKILSTILFEFPVESIDFNVPAWINSLPDDHPVKDEIIKNARAILNNITTIKDISNELPDIEGTCIKKAKTNDFDFISGNLAINFDIDEKLYYSYLSEMTGEKIEDDYALIDMIKRLTAFNREYHSYIDAIDTVKNRGYSVVIPDMDEITLSDPEVIKNGSKYGVKIKADSPSIHMIKVNIGSEISPIVGTKEQAEDLLQYIRESKTQGDIWETNIFGKTIGDLTFDGINTKIQSLNDDCRTKLMDTMQKVVNESSNGIVCLII